jgi:hypothetical protein
MSTFGRRILSRLLTYLPIVALLFAIFGASGEAYYALTEVRRMLDAPEPGATYHLAGWRWVTVMNPDGVDTAEQHLGFRESCLARYKAEVQAIGHSLLKGTLVTLRNPEGRAATGVLCPDGTAFFSSDSELARWQAAFQQRLAQEADLVAFAQGALDRPAWGTALAVQQWDWVEVMNPGGITAFGYDVEFLETCAIDAGGAAQAIGQDDRFGTLAYYTADPGLTFEGIGIPCPTGTVFVLESDRSFRVAGNPPRGAVHPAAAAPARLSLNATGSAHRGFKLADQVRRQRRGA